MLSSSSPFPSNGFWWSSRYQGGVLGCSMLKMITSGELNLSTLLYIRGRRYRKLRSRTT